MYIILKNDANVIFFKYVFINQITFAKENHEQNN